jgi:hypothetical protein
MCTTINTKNIERTCLCQQLLETRERKEGCLDICAMAFEPVLCPCDHMRSKNDREAKDLNAVTTRSKTSDGGSTVIDENE